MRLTENYTILVVEDEVPIQSHVVRKLETLDLPLQVIGTASDGQEAIRFIQDEQPPQIIITDIRMPGMDGLSLCKYLFENHPAIKIVVLSGYGEFEYAQAAIQYQVSDYLLKPLNAQKLYDTMAKLCDEIGQNRLANQRQCLARQLAGSNQTEEFPYQFEQSSFGLYLICLGNVLDHAGGANHTQYSKLWNSTQLDAFLEREKLDCWWSIEERNPNERMLLVAGHAPGLAPRLHAELVRRLTNQCSVNLCEAGQEVEFSEIWNVARKMRERLRQSLIPCKSSLFVLSAVPERKNTPKTFRQALDIASRDHAASNLKGVTHLALQEFCAMGATQYRLERAIQELLQALMERQTGGPGSARRIYERCCQEIGIATDATTLYHTLDSQLAEAIDRVGSTVHTDDLATTVKAYIDEHYQEEITLEVLAEHFHFSDSYITRLFRTQYGTPPVKYLLRRRIERAKELIEENENLSFGTIAELVGYTDQHYFSRLFRISTGMSPSEYRISVSDSASNYPQA